VGPSTGRFDVGAQRLVTPPIRGRADELKVIGASVTALVQGRGGALVIEGPPGIGKSRLLTEVMALADKCGVRTLFGEAFEYQQTVPFFSLFMATLRADPPIGAQEMCRCVPAVTAGLWRFDTDDEITLLAGAADPAELAKWPVGTRTPIEGNTIATLVQRTGRVARMDCYENVAGPIAAGIRGVGVRAAVGAPIIVDGRLWGLAAVGSKQRRPMPADTEARISHCAELIGTVVVAGYRDEQNRQLLAEVSRRLNRAADRERRRIERDLHDGAQQQLVTLALHARAAEASAPAELSELKDQLSRIASGLAEVSRELQDIARGIHPPILANGGLPAAIKELARRAPVRVHLDVAITKRLPEPIEVATYYLVAEALTNTAKHAQACTVHIRLDTDDTDAVLRVWVRDDGRGGADLHGGSGLAGLKDRVEALGGRLWLHSTPGAGTTLHAELPLSQARTI
jgi:signal transduction histidine kinase